MKTLKANKRFNLLLPALASLYSKNLIKAQEESEEDLNLDIDDPEQEEMRQMLNDPDLDPDTYQAIVNQNKVRGYQPIPFSKMNNMFRTGLEDESWKGLRLGTNWNPTQMFKLDSYLMIESPQKMNYKLNSMTIVPDKTNPYRALYLMGSRSACNMLGLQSHIALSQNDQVCLIAQFPKANHNEVALIAEYERTWDRLHTGVKLSNMGSSVSVTTTLAKDTFLGFEAQHNPRSNTFVYSYGVYRKHLPNLSFALMYISHVPIISFDVLYRYNKYWKMYFNYTKNKSPMIAMTGGKETDLKMTHVVNVNKNTELAVEVDYQGGIHAYVEHKVHKNIKVQGNLEFNPFARFSKKNKKVFHAFGIGLKYETRGQELFEKPDEDDDFTDLEYDKL